MVIGLCVRVCLYIYIYLFVYVQRFYARRGVFSLHLDGVFFFNNLGYWLVYLPLVCKQVDASPSASRILTASTEPKATSELLLIVYAAFHCLFFSYSSSSSYLTLSFFSSQPVLSVKFFLHATGNIAAKFLYDQVIVDLPVK